MAKRNLFGLSAKAAPLVAALALAGCSTGGYETFSDDTDGQPQSVEGSTIKGIMSAVGAIDPQTKPIEFKPRAALVIPPKRDLKAPEDEDAQLAGRNFPKNPEDRRGGQAAGGDSAKVMSLAEQDKFSNLPKAAAPRQHYPGQDGERMTPQELARGHGGAGGSGQAGQVAKRKTLIDPPDTYSKPAPNAPYEEEKPKESSWKPSWWPI